MVAFEIQLTLCTHVMQEANFTTTSQDSALSLQGIAWNKPPPIHRGISARNSINALGSYVLMKYIAVDHREAVLDFRHWFLLN